MKPFLVQAALCAAALAAPAAAQQLSDGELTQRFIEQRQLGATRGLVLNKVDPTQEAEPGMPPPVSVEASTGAAGVLPEPGAGGALPDTIYVDMPNPSDVFVQVTFAFDSAALAEEQKPQLRQICNVLDAAGVGTLRIVGHTDAAGPARYNQRLSVLRAEEVQRFFVDDCGIAPDRLQAVGVGEQFPFDAADPYADDNRRVEFQAIS